MSGAPWTEQLFLAHADIFLRIHEHALDPAEAQAEAVAAILDRGGVKPPAEILDAPCGIGRHAVHLARFGFWGTGLAFAPAFLARARQLAAGVGSNPEFVLGGLREG